MLIKGSLFILFLVSVGLSNPICLGFYKSDSGVSGRRTVALREMVLLHRDIVDMDLNNPEKALMLGVLKTRLSQLSVLFGSGFKNEFLSRINDNEASSLVIQKKKETQKINEQKQEEENVFKGFRKIEHESIDVFGPFLTDYEFFTLSRGDLILYNYKTKKEVWRIDFDAYKFPLQGSRDNMKMYSATLRLTPDKKHLIVIDAGRIVSIDLQTKEARFLYMGSDLGGGYLSEDGRHIYYVQGSSRYTHILDTVTLTEIVSSLSGNFSVGSVKSVTQSKDGRYVMFLREFYGTTVYDTVEKSIVDVSELNRFQSKQEAVFLPNSSSVLIRTWDKDYPYVEFNLATKQIVPSKLSGDKPLQSLLMSSNEKYLVTHGWKENKYEILAYDSSTYKVTPHKIPTEKFDAGYSIEFENVLMISNRKHLQFVLKKAGHPTLVMHFDLDSLTYTLQAYNYDEMNYVVTVSPDRESLLGFKNRSFGGALLELY